MKRLQQSTRRLVACALLGSLLAGGVHVQMRARPYETEQQVETVANSDAISRARLGALGVRLWARAAQWAQHVGLGLLAVSFGAMAITDDQAIALPFRYAGGAAALPATVISKILTGLSADSLDGQSYDRAQATSFLIGVLMVYLVTYGTEHACDRVLEAIEAESVGNKVACSDAGDINNNDLN